MKVKFLKDWPSVLGQFKKGDVADLSQGDVQTVIDGGYAEKHLDTKSKTSKKQ